MMDFKTISAMLISLVFVMPVIALLVEKQDRKDKIKNNIGTALYLKTRKNPAYRIYTFLLKFPLTGGYIQKISRRYELICPGNPRTIADKTLNLAGTSFLLCSIEIFLFYYLQPNMINFILAIYLIFVINNEIVNYFVCSAEIKLLQELERFISNVGNNYFINYFIDEAIFDAIDNRMSDEMNIHAKKLYDIVTSNTLKEDVARYNTTVHNKYLKMFLSLCINVLENDDRNLNGQQLLNLNLINLKKEINLEYLKQRQLRFVFSGAIFASVAVCIPLTWIQKFGISIAPELETIYSGKIGILYVALIFITSAFVYVLINSAKEVKKPIVNTYPYLIKLEKVNIIKAALDNFTEKFYGLTMLVKNSLKRLGETITPKQLLLKSIITSLITFVVCTGLLFYMHENNKRLITEKAADAEILTSAGTVQTAEVIADTILQYVNRFKEVPVTPEQLKQQIKKDGKIYNETIIQEVADEILSRVARYQKEYFQWYELFISLAIAAGSFFVPFLIIFYRRRLLVESMEDEVIQFNSIIYMMMFTEHVTVIDLLEQMEMFAVVFKPTIRECINEYNSGDIIALEKMKEREVYEPFLKLVDSIIRCDHMPIEKAFDKIACDRENYYERQKLENQIKIQKKADNVKPLAFLPAVLVIIYLVLPLLFISMKGLIDLKKMMDGMGIY